MSTTATPTTATKKPRAPRTRATTGTTTTTRTRKTAKSVESKSDLSEKYQRVVSIQEKEAKILDRLKSFKDVSEKGESPNYLETLLQQGGVNDIFLSYLRGLIYRVQPMNPSITSDEVNYAQFLQLEDIRYLNAVKSAIVGVFSHNVPGRVVVKFIPQKSSKEENPLLLVKVSEPATATEEGASSSARSVIVGFLIEPYDQSVSSWKYGYLCDAIRDHIEDPDIRPYPGGFAAVKIKLDDTRKRLNSIFNASEEHKGSVLVPVYINGPMVCM